MAARELSMSYFRYEALTLCLLAAAPKREKASFLLVCLVLCSLPTGDLDCFSTFEVCSSWLTWIAVVFYFFDPCFVLVASFFSGCLSLIVLYLLAFLLSSFIKWILLEILLIALEDAVGSTSSWLRL